MPDHTPKELFDNNLRLVDGIAGYFSRKFDAVTQYDEVHQWGLIGLWDASKRWKGNEYEFRFYARQRIKGQILDELRRNGRYIRRLSNDKQPKYVDDFDFELNDPTKATVDQIAHARMELQKLEKALQRLSVKETCIVLLYYLENVTLQEIAVQLGVTKERVSQIKAAAVAKLVSITGVNLDL